MGDFFFFFLDNFTALEQTEMDKVSHLFPACHATPPPSHSDFVTRPPSFLSSVVGARLKNGANSD